MIGGAAILGANPDWRVTHVADFNGDGKADLLWQNTNGAVTIWLMNGITTISAAGLLGANPDWRVTHTADLNGDGKADVLWRNINTGSITAWLMNGTAAISAAGILNDPNWSISHTADFNGDGKADLLWRNTNGGVTIWFMNGLGNNGAVGLLGADPNWRVTHIGDYNGDGKADIVWRNAADGSIAMWLINGTTVISQTTILGASPWVISPTLLTLPPATTLPSGFSDPGFTRGALRSEYDQGVGAGNSWLTLSYSNNGLPGAEGCLWNASDPINTYRVGCPGRAPLGVSDTPWYGANQFFDACRVPSSARVGDSWLSCISYRQSNQFSVNWTPNSDYWVLSANSEPSFDQCNLGPPSLSWPIGDYYSFSPSYFKAGTEVIPGTNRRRAHVVINANDFSHRCQNDPNREWIFTIPFLSVGAQQGRGQSNPIAYITNPPYARYHSTDNISFDAAMYSYQAFGCVAGTPTDICTQSNSGAHAGMYITAQWGGKNRQIFLDFFGSGSLVFPTDLSVSRLHFNWPIANSMFYPGAEIVFFNPSTLQNLCGISYPNLPINSAPSTSALTHYQFNASEVFSCASRLGKFDSPMPLNTEIPLIGAHWYVEGVGTQGLLGIAFENMKTN
jgi:FG-GAP-like repeat